MVNLLNNAVKFTDPGGTVTVRLEEERDRARVSIRDTGIGIAPEVLPRVFESFTQGERSLDRSRGGLGLGLALVKGLVELHGGEVRGSSPGLGQGSEFTFRLPRAVPASETTAAEKQPSTPTPEARRMDATSDTAAATAKDS
jgi:signal transduction histidine kinase